MHDRPKCSLRAASSSIVDVGPLSLQKQVQQGLNLELRLKNPTQMLALLASIMAMKPGIDAALRDLHYVHFARFLPSSDGSILYVITTFDADTESYIRDFAAVLAEPFSAILQFVRDAPRLPVHRYPDDFWNFVNRNNRRVGVWSAYPNSTVLEIQAGVEYVRLTQGGPHHAARME